MDINLSEMAGQCIEEINKKIKNLKHLNIIVIGKTGVGKSTLINYIFREQLAETGVGKPITQHMKEISKKNFPLTIYDTKGIELGRDTQIKIKQEIIKCIRDGLYTNDQNKCIHCIWYCINAASDRIEESEIDWIREFSEENKETRVPIIVVLTKAFSRQAEEFRRYIDNLNLNICAIIPVLAQDYQIDDDYTKKAYGAEQLIEVMGQVLGEELIPTLQNVQKAAIKQKTKYAHSIVAATIAGSFAEGFAPIPFADATLLIPTQVTMIASITVAFGIDVDKALITAFISSILGTTGATVAGRIIAANLLKLVPGVGTVVGGMISGGTAAALTMALGETYIKLLEKMYRGDLAGKEVSGKEALEEMKQIFKLEYKGKKSSKE